MSERTEKLITGGIEVGDEMSSEDAWNRAQRIHALEHATDMPLCLSCEVIGHLPLTDVYQSMDRDYERKFAMAMGLDW